MIELRHSTEQTIPVGVLLEYKITTPNAPITGTQLDWLWWTYIIKADGTVVNIENRNWIDVPNCNGVYFLTLTSSDTDKLGRLVLYIMDVELGYPVYKEFNVVTKNYYDAKYKDDGSLIVVSQHPRSV